ncbi:TonB family protein [Arenimonas sp.]|uniref:TonB family protein n=1 Tax=Arenimonas sp. TaxID=1872635 RepID=UPI0025BDE708|nr:TonB family protein [Arenimonas sp.]
MASDALIELLQASVALTLALALVLALRRPLRRWAGARAAYACWAIAPLAVMAVLVPAPTGVSATIGTVQAVSLFAAMPTTTQAAVSMAPGLLGLWLLGAAAWMLLMLVRQRRFLRSVTRLPGQAHDASEWATPAVSGLWRPRIVLPSDFQSRYTPDEQRLVIAHEQLHIERGDIPAQALATLMRCLFWFHPLVHVAAARFRFDQELACDAAVVARFPAARRSYGDAMLKTQLAAFGLPVGCHWQSSHPLKERISMLKQTLPSPRRRRIAAVLTLALAATTTLAAWAAQPVAPAAGAVPLSTLTDVDSLTPPKYPKEAADQGLGGMVMLEILVGVDGVPKEIKVAESTPAGLFDQQAVEAAWNWRFNAGRNGASGERVEGWVRVPVSFKPDEPAEARAAE